MAPFDHYEQRKCCNGPLEKLKWMLKTHSAPSEVLPGARMHHCRSSSRRQISGPQPPVHLALLSDLRAKCV